MITAGGKTGGGGGEAFVCRGVRKKEKQRIAGIHVIILVNVGGGGR
jgi:hypothetical protein